MSIIQNIKKSLLMRSITFTLITLFVINSVDAQIDTLGAIDDSLELEFQQLLGSEFIDEEETFNEEVSFFGSENKISREVASIISVVSSEDIQTYGARDLSEILRLVPGFELGIDAAGIIGTNFRGVNVHEGKQLLMINGVMMNELAYGNTNNIGTIPASAIDRIEIIRGPGSATYGGFAGLAVINVITKGGSLNGTEVTSAIGSVGDGGTYTEGTITSGARTDKIDILANVGYLNMPLSTRTFSDFNGNSLDMNNENFYRRYTNAYIQALYENFRFTYNHTNFTYPGHDQFQDLVPVTDSLGVTEVLNNEMDVLGAEYKFEVSPFIHIRPYIQYSGGNAIASSSITNSQVTFDLQQAGLVRLERYTGGLTSDFDMKKLGKITLGINYFQDKAANKTSYGYDGLWASIADTAGALIESTDVQKTNSIAGIIQYSNQFGDIGVTGGMRYEATTFGNAFAPRLGLTYVKEAFNAKLLYGRAFRIPLPWQQYTQYFGTAANGINLEPETSNTLELELGYKVNAHISAKLNAFFIDIETPIVFDVDSYYNIGKIQSRGIEAEVVAKYDKYGGFLNLSYVKPGGETSSTFVTTNGNDFVASPPFKLNIGGYYDVTDNLKIAPSLTYLGSRYGQSDISPTNIDLAPSQSYDPLALLNLNIKYSGLLNDALDLGIYGGNLLNQEYVLLQPYYGGHAPLPALDRKLIFTITIHLD